MKQASLLRTVATKYSEHHAQHTLTASSHLPGHRFAAYPIRSSAIHTCTFHFNVHVWDHTSQEKSALLVRNKCHVICGTSIRVSTGRQMGTKHITGPITMIESRSTSSCLPKHAVSGCGSSIAPLYWNKMQLDSTFVPEGHEIH